MNELILHIKDIIAKAKEQEFESDDVIYIDSTIGNWENLIKILKEPKE